VARLFPHYVSFAEWQMTPLLLSLIVLVVIHEALHAYAIRIFAKVEWRNIKFGVMWQVLTPYCHCSVPISVRAYRRVALLPLWVTGPASVAALLAFPSDSLGILAGIAIAACGGDVWVAAKLKRFAEDLLVKDSTSEIGCDVLSSAR